MNFFTRCFTKKSPPTSPGESPIEPNGSKTKEIDDRKRLYNEHHFSSGMDLPVNPKTIYPSNILDKELVIGQFGEPQKAQRLAKVRHSANS